MFGRSPIPAVQDRPHLDLSGPRLRRSLEALVSGADTHGGIERYMDALKTQQLEHMERSLDHCRKTLDLGVRWR